MNYKGYEAYEVIINYVDNNRADFGNMTASYDRINTLEVRKSNVEVWHTTWHILKVFDILEDEGDTLTSNFNIYKLLKGF